MAVCTSASRGRPPFPNQEPMRIHPARTRTLPLESLARPPARPPAIQLDSQPDSRPTLPCLRRALNPGCNTSVTGKRFMCVRLHVPRRREGPWGLAGCRPRPTWEAAHVPSFSCCKGFMGLGGDFSTPNAPTSCGGGAGVLAAGQRGADAGGSAGGFKVPGDSSRDSSHSRGCDSSPLKRPTRPAPVCCAAGQRGPDVGGAGRASGESHRQAPARVGCRFPPPGTCVRACVRARGADHILHASRPSFPWHWQPALAHAPHAHGARTWAHRTLTHEGDGVLGGCRAAVAMHGAPAGRHGFWEPMRMPAGRAGQQAGAVQGPCPLHAVA